MQSLGPKKITKLGLLKSIKQKKRMKKMEKINSKIIIRL